jgi:hypothetical protein
MSNPINIDEFSNAYPEYFKESHTPIQTYAPKKINLLSNEDRLGSDKGITYALILCIPFWILVIMLFAWVM